ncbi:MAG: hypothetical protein AAF721_05420 [Myxococcota bacterium]
MPLLSLLLVVALVGPAPAQPATPKADEEEPEPDESGADGIPDLGSLDAVPGRTAPPTSTAPPSQGPAADDGGLTDLGSLDALPGPASGSSSTPGPQPSRTPDIAPTLGEEDDGETFGDIFTGSMRLTGAFLHFDDVPELFPDGDDALLASVFRVIAKRDVGKHFGVELNYFLDLSRSPGGGAAAGAFTTAGSAGSVYRSPYLQYRFWQDGSMSGSFGADRFVFDAHAGPIDIAVGRFPVTYTVAGLFTPNDFFAPFSASAVNRIYKPGVDAVRVGSAIGMHSSVEVVGVLGNDDGGNPAWARSGLIARASTLRWGFEWAALGGKAAERWVAGGSAQGDVGPVTLRGEGHVGIPDREGDGRGEDDQTDDIHVRLATGPTVNIGWRNMILGAEYAFISDGAPEARDYLARAQRRFPDDQPQFARHYLGFNGALELVPILNAAVFTLVNANDGSGLVGASLIYNVADEADIIAGVFTPWGKGPELTGDPMNPILLGSEYGVSPVTVYLEARAFF